MTRSSKPNTTRSLRTARRCETCPPGCDPRMPAKTTEELTSDGYNVYPKKVEMLLDELPGVEESAVIGVPHPDFGEAVVAVIVPRKGAALAEQEVIAQLNNRLANYKLPKRVHVVAELPRKFMGKVQKNVLRDTFGPA